MLGLNWQKNKHGVTSKLYQSIKSEKFRNGMLTLVLCIGIMGFYYRTLGYISSYLALGIALAKFKKLSISPRLSKTFIVFIGMLLAGSLLTIDPIYSAKNCTMILVSMLFFLPGVYLGKQLTCSPLSFGGSISLAILFLSFFLSPHSHSSGIYYGFATNPNSVGQSLLYGFIVISICAAAGYQHLHAKSKIPTVELLPEITLVFALTVISILILFTNSRQIWLALPIGMVIFCFFYPSYPFKNKLVNIVAITCFATAPFLFFNRKTVAPFEPSGRLDIWMHSLNSWIHNFPFFGAGYGMFPRLPELYKYGALASVSERWLWPHNIIVDILFSGGMWAACVIGLFLYLYCQEVFFSISPASRPCRINVIALASLGGLTALIVVGFLDLGLTSFKYIGSLSATAGILYSQCKLKSSDCGGLNCEEGQ